MGNFSMGSPPRNRNSDRKRNFQIFDAAVNDPNFSQGHKRMKFSWVIIWVINLSRITPTLRNYLFESSIFFTLYQALRNIYYVIISCLAVSWVNHYDSYSMSHSWSRSPLVIKCTILLTRSFHIFSNFEMTIIRSLTILQRSWDDDLDFQTTIVRFFTTRGALPMKYSSTTRPNPRISKSRICQIWILHDTIFIQLSNFMSVQPTQSFWSRDCNRATKKTIIICQK